MGYEIYITRAPSHLQTKEFPISRGEWQDVADSDDELVYSNEDWYERRLDSGEVERMHPWRYIKHPDRPPLWFSDGAVHTKSPDQATIAKLVSLAKRLNAIVLDEDGGSSYGADGTWKPWEPPADPRLPWWKRLFGARN
ncbi:hypothetical protein ACGLHS_07510 [Variovorax sp. VaC1]|uniref:hypothetical protein n=1 Tax=Variovorax sp. VaC1 TaxID=3373132 RepID=UPI00374971AD